MSIFRSISVGLGGDGDEIEAIQDVETAFGVRLDAGDAPLWRSAGDLYASLRKALPAAELKRPDVWDRFATALTGVTGVDPKSIDASSPLLSESRVWSRMADASAIVWFLIVAGFVIAIGLALL